MSQLFSYDRLFDFSYQIFKAIGCSEEHAYAASKVLLSADLRGIDSHGIARLSGYVRLWEAKRINVNPDIKIIHESPSTATIDGDAGLGLVVAPFAMELAIKKAAKCGTGWVCVNNSNHFGIAGYYSMMALKYDMIGIAMTNASALVSPTHSCERMLGTNPISVSVPAFEEPPFVADFATTTAANGKLEILQRKEQEAPIGWVQTAEGAPSNDANILKKNGSLLPLGSDIEGSSHKGYALGSIVDIFSGVLSGANYGPWVPPFPAYVPMPENQPGKGVGHFFGALRIDAFRPAEDFKKSMDHWIKRFRNAKSIEANKRVMIHGDPERETELIRKKEGIPLLDSVANELDVLGKKFDLVF